MDVDVLIGQIYRDTELDCLTIIVAYDPDDDLFGCVDSDHYAVQWRAERSLRRGAYLVGDDQFTNEMLQLEKLNPVFIATVRERRPELMP